MKATLVIISMMFCCASAFALVKNKVVYNNHQWKIIETRHFSLYVPDDFPSMSNQFAAMTEDIYMHHSQSFDYKPAVKVLVTIYRDEIDFQQNNILTFIPEF